MRAHAQHEVACKCLETTDSRTASPVVSGRRSDSRRIEVQDVTHTCGSTGRCPIPAVTANRTAEPATFEADVDGRKVACRSTKSSRYRKDNKKSVPPSAHVIPNVCEGSSLYWISGRSLISFRDDKNGEWKCEHMRDTRSLVNAWRQRTDHAYTHQSSQSMVVAEKPNTRTAPPTTPDDQ